jgi:hypothetical protein
MSAPDRALPVPSPDVVARRVDHEVVLVNLKSNRIFALNPTGARFWELLAGGAGRAEIEHVLAGEYAATREEIGASIDALLAELRAERLVHDPGRAGS